MLYYKTTLIHKQDQRQDEKLTSFLEQNGSNHCTGAQHYTGERTPPQFQPENVKIHSNLLKMKSCQEPSFLPIFQNFAQFMIFFHI